MSRDAADVRTPRRHRAGRRAARGATGQALAELALVLPMLTLVLMSVLDLGRAFHTQVAVFNAARVGLLYGQQVVSPRGCVNLNCPFLTVRQIISQTIAEAQGGVTITPANVTVYVNSPTPATGTDLVGPDEPITISISVPFQAITPFVHLGTIGGTASGRTFAYDSVLPTPTPGGSSAAPSPTASYGPSNWTAQTIGSQSLNGVACPGVIPTVCYAVGDNGQILAYNGTSWTPQTSGTTAFLNFIACLSASTCYAVGTGGAISVTVNSGSSWSPTTGSSNTSQVLNAIACPQATPSVTCYAVGGGGTILYTSNGGSTWSPQNSGTTAPLNGIYCASISTCIAVGSNGTILRYNDGAWSVRGSVTAVSLNAVTCADLNDCYAVGGNGTILYSNTGGASWTIQTSGTVTTQALNGISCPSFNPTIICYVVGGNGTVLQTSGGTSWSTQITNTAVQLNAVACSGTTNCVVVGRYGLSLSYGMPVPTPTPLPSNTPLNTPTPGPTNTPGGPTSTPTTAPTNTPTPTPTNTLTPTPQPAPVLSNLTCKSGGGSANCDNTHSALSASISWTTNESNAGNNLFVRPVIGAGTPVPTFTPYQTSNGTAPTFIFYSGTPPAGIIDYAFLPGGGQVYEYYVQSVSSAPLTSTLPSGCPVCTLSGINDFTLQ